MNLEGKRDRSSAYVKDENGVLLRDVELIRERWVRWFYNLLKAKSPRLDPNIAEGLEQWPENMPPEVQPTIQKLTDAIRSLANGRAVRPDGVSVGLFQDRPQRWSRPAPETARYRHLYLEGGARCRSISSGKMPSSLHS